MLMPSIVEKMKRTVHDILELPILSGIEYTDRDKRERDVFNKVLYIVYASMPELKRGNSNLFSQSSTNDDLIAAQTQLPEEIRRGLASIYPSRFKEVSILEESSLSNLQS